MLLGMSGHFIKNAAFDFVANVLSNVAALKEGREYMIDNDMLESIVAIMKN